MGSLRLSFVCSLWLPWTDKEQTSGGADLTRSFSVLSGNKEQTSRGKFANPSRRPA